MELDDRLPGKVESARIDSDEEIKEDTVCLEIIENDEYIPILTLGNFSAITGGAKSRKSFFGILILGVMAAGHNMFDKFCPKIRKMVILFDTEQGKSRVQKSMKRIVKIAGTNDNLIAYDLRPFKFDERIKMIEFAIYNNENVGFVLLDGIRDLVSNINDPDQATKISDLLMKWTAERNIHIMVIIHQNKADKNPRGHIGTEIMNKSETVIQIEKDTEERYKSLVVPQFTRGLEFDEFEFFYHFLVVSYL